MPQQPIKVLLVEDDAVQARLVREYLSEVPWRPVILDYAETIAEAKARLTEGGIDVVLLDLSLPDSDGPASFVVLHWAFRGLPIIVLTGLQDQELSDQLVQAGAQDYLVKNEITGPLLYRTIRHAIERRHLEAERERLVHELREALARVNSLGGMLPICGNCKKIRDDQGVWTSIEQFISANTAASFSHSLCPHCVGHYLPDGMEAAKT